MRAGVSPSSALRVCVRASAVPPGLVLFSHFTQDLRPRLTYIAAPRLIFGAFCATIFFTMSSTHFGAGQPRRLSLRGLILNAAPNQRASAPEQQERKKAGETMKANSFA